MLETHLYKAWPNWGIYLEYEIRLGGFIVLFPTIFHTVKEDEQFSYDRRGVNFLFFKLVFQKETWKGPSVKKAGFNHG